ncbi:hypothetical protein JCM3765_006923 [Sporobolomyces pararoseus]
MSGTRDFLRMAARMYPSSQPPCLSDYRSRDPILEGHDFESPASSNRLVHFLEATHSAARLHPPELEVPRPIAPLPRRHIPLPRPQERGEGGGGGSTATRRLPSSAYNQSSTSTSASASRKSGKEVQTLRGEKRSAKKDKPEWKDLPYSNDFSLDSEFLDLPPSVLDRILGNAVLNLRDHLALAATCRSLRACYYTPTTTLYSSLWGALVALRPPIEQGRLITRKLASKEIEETIHKIWSNSLKVDPESMQVILRDENSNVEEEGGGGVAAAPAKKQKKKEGAIRSKEWENAIDLVHTIRISKTEAKKIYKLNESELSKYLSSFAVDSKGAATRLLYLESAVESLALRLHGGVEGHARHVARAIEIARKKKSTRELNSGLQQRGGRGGSRGGSSESE